MTAPFMPSAQARRNIPPAGLLSLHASPRYKRELMERTHTDVLVCGSCHWRVEKPPALEMGVLFAIHHANNDHEDFAAGNLSLQCHPCHVAAHIALGGVDVDYDAYSGEIVYLPGASQAEIIELWRTAAVLQGTGHRAAMKATTLYGKLKGQGEENIQALLDKDTTLKFFTTDQLRYWVSMASEEEYEIGASYLDGLRFLPGLDDFPTLIEFCRNHQAAYYGL